MKKGSQILKLPVVNVDANEKMGVVTGFVFDPAEKKVAALIIEPQVPMEGLRAIPFENVASIYDSALMVENLKEPVNLSEHKSLLSVFLNDINLVGGMVVSDEGKTIGVARDFVIDPGNGRLLQINVRIRGGSGERVIAHDDIIKITAEEITARTRPGQITLRTSPDAALADERKPAAPPIAERKTFGDDYAARRKPPVEAKSYAERTPASEPASLTSKHLVEEVKKEIRTELFALFETFFSDRIKTHFLEMARMILERINQSQQEEKLQSLRDEIIAELSKLPKKDDAKEERRGELQEQAGSLSLLVEEKIKQGAGNRLDSLASRVEDIEKTLGDMRAKAEAASGDVRNALKEQAEALKNIPLELRLASGDSLEPRIREAVAKLDGLGEGLDLLNPIAEKTDALKEQVGGLRDEMLSLREIQDSLRQTWMEISTGLSERFGALESRFMADEGRDEEKTRALVDKISGIISSQNRGLPGKDEILSLTTKLETASARLKNLEDEASGATDEILAKIDDSARALSTELHAAVTRSAAPLLDNMKRSLEKRMEEMKTRTDTFKDEMVELQDAVRTSAMRVEKKFDERLTDEIDRLSKTISGIASAAPDGDAIKIAMDGVLASIKETAASLSEKLETQNDPIKDRLATQQKFVVEQLQSLRESVSSATEATAKKIDEVASALPAESALKDLKDELISSFNEATGKIGEKLETIGLADDIEDLKKSLSQSVGEISGKLEDKLAGLASKLDESSAGINGKLETIGLADEIEELKASLSQSVTEIYGRVKSELPSLVSKEELAKLKEEIVGSVSGFKEEIIGGMSSPVVEKLVVRLEKIVSRITFDEESVSSKEEILAGVNESLAKIRDEFRESAARLDATASLESLRDSLSKSSEEIERKVEKVLAEISAGEQVFAEIEKIKESSEQVASKMAAQVEKSLAEQVETLKDALRPSDAAPAFERLENEIEDLRNFVKQKVTEIADITEIAREDAQKRILDGLDDLLRKNVSDRLESFISKNLDSSLSGLLEKIAGQPDAAKGIFGRASRPKDKPAPKPRTPEKTDTAAEKRLEYLIGRTVGKDLLDDDGNPVVAKGTVVDEKLLAVMREKRRLLDLIQCIDFTQ